VAESLAGEAAAFVRRRRVEVFGADAGSGDDAAVRTKTTPTDPVTVVDTETERLLRDRLAKLRSDDAVLGEEIGGPGNPTTAPAGAVTWVLDPIDGTVNFVYGIPSYAVSVAAQVDGVSVAGAVADVVGRRLYSAGLGLGAHVVDAEGTRQLRCSAVDELSLALVGTGFAYSRRRRTVQATLVAKVLPVVRDVRRIGSAALDLCMVAAGRLEVGQCCRGVDRRRGRRAGAVAGAGGPGGDRGVGGRCGARDRRPIAGCTGAIRRSGSDSGLIAR